MREEAIDRGQTDVIGIHVPAFLPAEGVDGFLCRGAHALRFRPNEFVFPIRLIPNRHHLDSVRRDLFTRAQLGFGLMGKAVADAEGEFFESEHVREIGGGSL